MEAALALAVGGQVVSGIQGYQAGKTQKKAYEQQAESERRSAEYSAQSEADRARRYRASQLAALGKSGVQATGTPLDVMTQTALQQERDILAIKYGGEVRKRRALGEASIANQAATAALIGGLTGAAGTYAKGKK